MNRYAIYNEDTARLVSLETFDTVDDALQSLDPRLASCMIVSFAAGGDADDYAAEDPTAAAQYPGGLCPDCGEKIPDDAVYSDACSNCGHVFVWGPDAAEE